MGLAMKITIDIQMPSREQAAAVKKPAPSLAERIEYALDQIRAETKSKKRAVEFLREAFVYLDGLSNPTEKQRALKEEIKPVINEYGMYHKGSSQKE